MAGFIQDPIQFINLIADNLRDRYQSGFPVLKELIQNTDDSGASELHFGYSPSLPEATHALLRGPALFFINNGRFSKTDALGIRSFGQNNKAADEAVIGKFGLGMKSVFHFCEAFFFLAHDGERPYAEILNPWSGSESVESLHADWDQFSDADAQSIREHLMSMVGISISDLERLFILWLPLRRKAHLKLPDGGHAGAIVAEYPGDDQKHLSFLKEEDLSVRLAALMPLLQHLERVSFWDLKIKKETTGPDFEVRFDDGLRRLSLLQAGAEQDGAACRKLNPAPIGGRVRIVAGASRLLLGSSGLEGYGWNPTLDAMHGHELWPSSYIRDSKGHSKEAKDKARPHGAVFFSRSPGRGRLIINWSVFLPLDEVKSVEIVRCGGDQEFRLTLHGYFFVDAGRQRVYGLEECDGVAPERYDSEEVLRRCWNCELLRSRVLPLLLPALENFCSYERLSEKSKTALTAALMDASVVRCFREPIAEGNSWIREITPEGIGWVLCSAERPVLRLPEPPEKDPERPWKLFPTLHAIAETHWLAIADAPNLMHSSVDAQWQEEQLLELFESVNSGQLFAEATLLDYLANFLAQPAGPYRNALSVKRALAKLVRQGLITSGEEGLRQNETRVRRIVGHLDVSACFKVGNDLPRALLQGVLSADTDVLPLPARFIPQEFRVDSELSISDASRLLKGVEETLASTEDSDKDLQNAALKLSEQLIKGVPAQRRSELLSRCADLRVLGSFDCKKDRRVPVSVHDIREANEAGTLFGSAEGTTERARLGLATELQKVMTRERVLVINRETASLALDREGAVRACDEHAVLRCLGMKPRMLGGLNERAALAGLAHVPASDIEVRGLRFLLHADPEHFQNEDTLWVLGRNQAAVWQKLWSQLVGGTDKPWNLLDSSVADALSRREWDAIDIHEISAQAVLDEIERKGVSVLEPSDFDQDECEQILKEVRTSDDELWRLLPFHWTRNGEPVSGTAEGTYLDTGKVTLSDTMQYGVHLIRLSDDGALSQRQQRLLTPLDEQAVIRIALGHADYSGRWRVMLEALYALDRHGNTVSPQLMLELRNSKWLPVTDGESVKPEDVIDLVGAEEEINRILAREPGAFVTPGSLIAEIAKHPFFPRLRESYFAKGTDGLAQLGAALETLEAYQIGDVQFEDAEALAESAQVLGDHPNAGWQLLSTLIDTMGAESCFEALLPAIKGQIPIDSQVALLNWIPGRSGKKKLLARVFNRYLTALAREPEAASVLGQLTLLNKDLQWKQSAELVSGVSGVASVHVLHADQAAILKDVICQDQPTSDRAGSDQPAQHATETSSAGSIMRDYFDPWTGRVASPLISVLVSLFGSEDSVKTLCRDLLGQHSRDWLLSRIPWESPRSDATEARKAWLQGYSLENALDYFRMAVRIHEGDTISVCSILGSFIKVGLEAKFSNLFLDRPSYYSLDRGDSYRVELVLRRISTEDHSDEQLSGYLLSSANYLLREVFNQHRPDLDTLWQELGQSDQVDIELAKALILDNIPFYLKQLGAHNHPALREALDHFRENERQEKEFAKQPQAAEYRGKKEQALKALQQLIESDEQAQAAILGSVQRKIRDFQYQPESVPFELFQNADDALCNLELIDAYPAKPGDLDVEELPANVRQFVIEADPDQICFMHWGRAINQFGSRGFPGRERGFDRDLENMLILSASDKGDDVTGKFGLGFKSVWLVTDRPTVVSGRLQAVIVGGVLPIADHGDITQRLVSRLAAQQSDRRWPGTAIHLPLLGVSEDTMLKRFSDVAGAMVAFSRSLRTVEIQRGKGHTFSASWESRSLAGIHGMEMGRIRQGDGDPLLVMKVSLPDGALMLAVGPSGFIELPKVIPNLWVTAPIREQERLGFAVNAMFEVDAGRSRLSAEVEKNCDLARRLGQQLAAKLDDVRSAIDERWIQVAKSMEFSDSVEPYDFWHTLWRTLMSRLPQLERESGSRLVAMSLLGEGLRDLAQAYHVVPNGLPRGLRRLIRSDEANIVLRGALSDAAVLQAVANAACFQPLLNTGHAVTSDMATWLRLLIQDLSQRTDRLISVSLESLIRQLERGRAMAPKDASILGEVLHPKAPEDLEKGEDEVSQEVVRDFTAAAKSASELSFLSASGSDERCRQLLTDQGSEDEKRRWAFAPDQHRLAHEYGHKGAVFFLWCRDRLEAPADTLKNWIYLATEVDRRVAALSYLLEGELAVQVVEALQDQGYFGTWLADIDEHSEYLVNFDEASRNRLVYQVLKSPEESRIAFQNLGSGIQEPEPEVEPIEPGAALQHIYDWWEEARNEHLERYRRETYPEGQSPVLRDDDAGNIDRASWLLVLLLGGFHTMGRVRPEQHRTFIENCRRRGWWAVFTDPNPAERFEDWMGVLDQYIDQQVDQQDYEQWMMRFPIIYKLSRHLDDYAELLLGLARYKRSFDIATILRPLADPDQQGGGIGAAPLTKTLGMGANFVIRELIRLGVIDSPYVREHAFVPYRRVRRLVREMGCDEAESEPQHRVSTIISGFLHAHMDADKVTFCRDFDIPLRIVAEDWVLQQELLGRALTDEEVY